MSRVFAKVTALTSEAWGGGGGDARQVGHSQDSCNNPGGRS